MSNVDLHEFLILVTLIIDCCLSQRRGWNNNVPDRIHSRKFGAAIVGAAIMLVGTSANCYPQTGSIYGRQGRVHCQHRERHGHLGLPRQDNIG